MVHMSVDHSVDHWCRWVTCGVAGVVHWSGQPYTSRAVMSVYLYAYFCACVHFVCMYIAHRHALLVSFSNNISSPLPLLVDTLVWYRSVFCPMMLFYNVVNCLVIQSHPHQSPFPLLITSRHRHPPFHHHRTRKSRWYNANVSASNGNRNSLLSRISSAGSHDKPPPNHPRADADMATGDGGWDRTPVCGGDKVRVVLF